MVINFNISLKHDFVGVVWIMGHIVLKQYAMDTMFDCTGWPPISIGQK